MAEVAMRLARHHAVEVLTTETSDGEEPRFQECAGVDVHRFPVAPRDAAAFDRAAAALGALDSVSAALGVREIPDEVADAFLEENVHAPGLLTYLDRHQDAHDAVVFVGYRSGLTLSAIECVAPKSFLRPFLRDEAIASVRAVERAFDACRRVLFGSEEEAALAARLYGPAMLRKGSVIHEADGAGWDEVAAACARALGLDRAAAPRRKHRHKLRAIHQVLPSIDYGDAISNQTVFTMEVLRELGYTSDIFVLDMSEAMRLVATRFTPEIIGPEDGILYHHAIGTALTEHVVRHPGPKALLYHNITPGHFFAPWDARFAAILEQGRRDLRGMAPHFAVSAGVSEYNATELREAGYRDPSVVPIFVEPLRWSKPADAEWMRILQDGRTNILFVGRVTPNKCQQDLLYAFKEYLAFDAQARLILVGVWPEGHPYARFLREEIERLGISSSVVMTSRVTEAQLLACYRTADLFWSMSEHEGFCVPLIEAMWFDVPVLAYRSSAIPETLGDAGMLFAEKGRWAELAALAHMLVHDRELRGKVLRAQQRRRNTFLPEAIVPSLLSLLARLAGEPLVDADRPQPSVEMTSEYPSTIPLQR